MKLKSEFLKAMLEQNKTWFKTLKRKYEKIGTCRDIPKLLELENDIQCFSFSLILLTAALQGSDLSVSFQEHCENVGDFLSKKNNELKDE